MRIIPGHFKAYTLAVLIILMSVAYIDTHQVKASVGMGFLVIGLFIADQAIHLAQADHSAPAPTRIERFMQRRRRVCVMLGTALAVFGTRYLF